MPQSDTTAPNSPYSAHIPSTSPQTPASTPPPNVSRPDPIAPLLSHPALYQTHPTVPHEYVQKCARAVSSGALHAREIHHPWLRLREDPNDIWEDNAKSEFLCPRGLFPSSGLDCVRVGRRGRDLRRAE